MKLSVPHMGFEIEDMTDVSAQTGCLAARRARARSVKVLFGLWLGMFCYAALWSGAWLVGVFPASTLSILYLQCAVLIASVLFYYGAKSIRGRGKVVPLSTVPLSISAVLSILALAAIAHSDPARLGPKADPAFWMAVREAHFGDAFSQRTVDTAEDEGLPDAPLPAAAAIGKKTPKVPSA